MKKIIVVISILFSLITLTSCISNREYNENKKINLSDVSEITVLKDVTIKEGEILSNFATKIELGSTLYQTLGNIEYEEKEQYAGLASYTYVIKIAKGEQINYLYIIDDNTFVYNSYKSSTTSGNFDFLKTLEFEDVTPVVYKKLDLSNVTEVVVGKDPTVNIDNTVTYKYNAKIELNSSTFTLLSNAEYVEKEEYVQTAYAYVIVLKVNDSTVNIFVIDDNTFVYNGNKCVTNANNLAFLKVLEYKSTTSSGSGWLPWV